jgi:hypothetical protein
MPKPADDKPTLRQALILGGVAVGFLAFLGFMQDLALGFELLGAGAAGLGVLAWYELRDRRGGKS